MSSIFPTCKRASRQPLNHLSTTAESVLILVLQVQVPIRSDAACDKAYGNSPYPCFFFLSTKVWNISCGVSKYFEDYLLTLFCRARFRKGRMQHALRPAATVLILVFFSIYQSLKYIVWGIKIFWRLSIVLVLQVQVPIKSDAACDTAYGNSQIKDSMVCAGLELGGNDACQVSLL